MSDPLRAFRVPDELWDAAVARAKDEDTPLSQLIRHWLADFVANGNYLTRRPKKRP